MSALLSKALLAFAHEFKRESELSLAINANVLRLLDGAGVSKESVAMALGFLAKRAFIVKSGNVVLTSAN